MREVVRMKEALENILSHLKVMDSRTAIKTLKKFGLWGILPERIQYGISTYKTEYWVLEAYKYLREVYRAYIEREDERKRNPLKKYGIDIL